MTEGLAIIVLGITIIAFWLKNIMLHMVGVIAWFVFGYYMYNQTWPPENPYLPTAIMFLAISLILVHTVTVIQVLITHRDEQRNLPSTSDKIQSEHRRKVLGLTKKREKPWYEE